MRCVAGDGVLTLDEFSDAIRRVAPQTIDDVAMAGLIERLDRDGDGKITIEEWLDFCVSESVSPTRCDDGGAASGVDRADELQY